MYRSVYEYFEMKLLSIVITLGPLGFTNVEERLKRRDSFHENAMTIAPKALYLLTENKASKVHRICPKHCIHHMNMLFLGKVRVQFFQTSLFSS